MSSRAAQAGGFRCKTILPWQDSFMRVAKSMLHGNVWVLLERQAKGFPRVFLGKL
jgi:hypothetical protein